MDTRQYRIADNRFLCILHHTDADTALVQDKCLQSSGSDGPIGGTVYEVETSCGGTELLYDKMVRLIRSETITDADKDHKARYNKDSNLFVGRSLQEE